VRELLALCVKERVLSDPEYNCPICGVELAYFSRYPNYICDLCVSQATDGNGRALVFFNTHMAGGLVAVYSDTNEKRTGHGCFVRGKQCYADAAYMGGIVLEIDA